MRVVDVFCGIGGASCGFSAVDGVQVVMGVDWDDRVLKTWATNTGGQAVCATVGVDHIPLPEAADDLFVHFSPPCTALSRARAGSATAEEVETGTNLLKWSLDQIVEKGYKHFSLEDVATPQTRAVIEPYRAKYPERIAYTTIECADYNVPQTRSRLIASTPAVIRGLKETPVQRLSISDALAIANHTLPDGVTHMKSNTTTRGGMPSLRSIQTQSFTLLASHPYQWTDVDGKTIRCCSVAEQAALQTFPVSWELPRGSRLGFHAVGNALPPAVATRIMQLATASAPPHPAQLPPPLPAPLPAPPTADAERSVTHAQLRALKRRIEALEKAVGAD